MKNWGCNIKKIHVGIIERENQAFFGKRGWCDIPQFKPTVQINADILML